MNDTRIIDWLIPLWESGRVLEIIGPRMTQSFHAVEYQQRDGVAVVVMRNPPANGLSHDVRLGLVEAFAHAIEDAGVRAVVLTGAGKGFSAGGDIRELGSPKASASPALSLDVHPVIEFCPKPTVAALHGFAIGGGLETALVCHYRLAAPDTRVALPEIQRGLIPLSGTQRLPRVLGARAAIDFILESKMLLAREFPRGTLFDELVEGTPDAVATRAIEYALAIAREPGRPPPLVRNRPAGFAAGHVSAPGGLAAAVGGPTARGATTSGGAISADGAPSANDAAATVAHARQRAAEIGPTATAAVEAIVAGLEAADFDTGMNRAREIYDALSNSDEVRRQRDRFLEGHSKADRGREPEGSVS